MPKYQSSYPDDHIIQTEWWSERITDGNMRGTRDHYIVMRQNDNGSAMRYVVHTGFKDSPERGYCQGDYYHTYWDALQGFIDRSRSNGFERAYDPHLTDVMRALRLAQGELDSSNTQTQEK